MHTFFKIFKIPSPFLRGSFLCFLLLASCAKSVLLQSLDQQNANEIMVVLAKNGIEAEKEAVEKQQEVSWSIKVAAKDEDRARQVLVDNNLPRTKQLGLAGLCKESGLIPTPKMEKCREVLGLKGEIINSLESIPGVISADVVINLPDKQDFPDPNLPVPRPTASVIVQFDGAGIGNSVLDETKVQQFVANTVNGMDMRDVAVIITKVGGKDGEPAVAPVTVIPADVQATTAAPSTPSADTTATVEALPDSSWVSVGGIRLAPESVKKFKIIVSAILFIFVVLSAGLVLSLMRMAQSRRDSSSKPLPPMVTGGNVPALPDQTNMDDLVAEAQKSTQNR